MQSEFITQEVEKIEFYLGELRAEMTMLEGARDLLSGHAMPLPTEMTETPAPARGRPRGSTTRRRKATNGRRRRAAPKLAAVS